MVLVLCCVELFACLHPWPGHHEQLQSLFAACACFCKEQCGDPWRCHLSRANPSLLPATPACREQYGDPVCVLDLVKRVERRPRESVLGQVGRGSCIAS